MALAGRMCPSGCNDNPVLEQALLTDQSAGRPPVDEERPAVLKKQLKNCLARPVGAPRKKTDKAAGAKILVQAVRC